MFCIEQGTVLNILCICVCVCVCAQLCPTPHGLQHSRPFFSWNFPGKITGVDCHFLLQGFFLTQGLNPHLLCLLHQQADTLLLNHLGSSTQYPIITYNEENCQGPAPADPGYSKERRHRRGSGYNSFNQILIKDIKSNRIRISQQENSVEKRG